MTARWHLGPVEGLHFWTILAFSPEILVFLFFMLTDPKTVPAGSAAAGRFRRRGRAASQRSWSRPRADRVLGEGRPCSRRSTIVCAARRARDDRRRRSGSSRSALVALARGCRRHVHRVLCSLAGAQTPGLTPTAATQPATQAASAAASRHPPVSAASTRSSTGRRLQCGLRRISSAVAQPSRLRRVTALARGSAPVSSRRSWPCSRWPPATQTRRGGAVAERIPDRCGSGAGSDR